MYVTTCENSTLGFRFALCLWLVNDLLIDFFWSHLFVIGLLFKVDSITKIKITLD